jgi:hypothetical protein
MCHLEPRFWGRCIVHVKNSPSITCVYTSRKGGIVFENSEVGGTLFVKKVLSRTNHSTVRAIHPPKSTGSQNRACARPRGGGSARWRSGRGGSGGPGGGPGGNKKLDTVRCLRYGHRRLVVRALVRSPFPHQPPGPLTVGWLPAGAGETKSPTALSPRGAFPFGPRAFKPLD